MQPLPRHITNMLLEPENRKHFLDTAHLYNNFLALAATGVDRGFPEGQKWVSSFGEHAITLHGRTYHTLGGNGLEHFTYQFPSPLQNNPEDANFRALLNNIFFHKFSNTLHECNPYVRDLVNVRINVLNSYLLHFFIQMCHIKYICYIFVIYLLLKKPIVKMSMELFTLSTYFHQNEFSFIRKTVCFCESMRKCKDFLGD